LDEIRLHGENKETKDEVTELARRYSIVTPYTAYLIVEDERRRNVTDNRRTMIQFEHDRAASEQAHYFYDSYKRDKDGDAGVAGARYSIAVKQVETLSDVRQLGVDNARRSQGAVAATPTPSSARGTLTGLPAITAPVTADPLTERVVAYTQQNRFVGGKSFYQNGDQWLDAELQKFTSAKPTQIRFGSPEYFDLLAKHPKVTPWLALGRKVQFVLDGAAYEITDERRL
ncbi:MAG: hypothetical protein HY300_00815, partial [Verrucomicrobia bacterium]|nr:hypothetical protein [Verrucomicrobiota bacterium]